MGRATRLLRFASRPCKIHLSQGYGGPVLFHLFAAGRMALFASSHLTYQIKLKPAFRGFEFYGAGDQIRTGDIRYHKPTL